MACDIAAGSRPRVATNMVITGVIGTQSQHGSFDRGIFNQV